ncbi:protein FAM131C isoform X2 [Xiphophorus couchianus]|uniref:protein FAM131C isoform X2 n=1 Tax=Xiphophorus couchianus TaxID=32473 RepID=UPI001015CDF6|nr:protein FAM131C isoform X2 [Xiphophorus couchianus]
MGACLCKGHKELHLPSSSLHQTEEGQSASIKDGQNPSNGTVADKSSRYDIAELATSSLIGLVATIKEHITKPTAMAQGRVAHLIEWKGWGGCGEGGGNRAGWSGGWSKGGGGWGAAGTELQEDEQFYSQMTDEIKEARFAAGVAEQFALAEAAMSMWSMSDNVEQPSTSSQGCRRGPLLVQVFARRRERRRAPAPVQHSHPDLRRQRRNQPDSPAAGQLDASPGTRRSAGR